ncbi:MAG: 30S ribosome-binding factor RbfA [Chloroflexi bacterium]|nr:30S ribosome-binding factor RbfA [Chloroflexota bacterium]MBI4198679.1 30S ribosome-binding factor RbfA [Chloroflexota bacterium]
MSRRTERVNDLLREEISYILAREMKDPRLSVLLTITRVQVSTDLQQAVVHVSIMGTPEEKKTTIELLRAAAGFIQRELKPKLATKLVPFLTFKLDESIEEGMRMFQLLDTPQGPKQEKT